MAKPESWYCFPRACVTGIVSVLALGSALHAQPAPPVGQKLMLRGFIAARVGGREGNSPRSQSLPARDVFLPAVEVYLGDAQGAKAGAGSRTDLSGRFTLYAPQAGRYRVCWRAQGFASGCGDSYWTLGDAATLASTIRIPIAARQDHVTFVGNVTMADGSRPRLFDPIANINAFATVTLLDAARQPLYTTPVNNFGEYLIPNVPIRAPLVLRAQIERGVLEEAIRPEAELERESLHEVNLRIPNTPPRLDSLLLSDPTTRASLLTAAPGATVAVDAAASDRDNDPIAYTWQVEKMAGSLSADNDSNARWELPRRPGQYQVSVIAWDGKGGYARSSVLLRVSDGQVPFSGIVRENGGTPIEGAAVEIAGARAVTDAAGIFHVSTPASTRYVLNIRKQGYAFYSKIYDRGITAGLWTLTRATVTTADPTRAIRAATRRTPLDCPGPRSLQLDWRGHPHAAVPQWQDGNANVIYPSRQQRLEGLEKIGLLPPGTTLSRERVAPLDFPRGQCGPGLSLSIPANSLVDGNGDPPRGDVEVSLATIDLLSPEQMPGDFTVKGPGGETRVMQSFGAGSIEITAGDKHYNLKPGARAEVNIPVDGAQLAAGGPLPASIPLLYYNEDEGVWQQDGVARLSGSGATRAYVATIEHFSTINADTLKTDQACVRILSPQPGMPSSYNLEVTVPQADGNAPKVFSTLIDNSAATQHVIYNLPTQTNIVLVPTNTSGNTTPLGIFIVNTGDKQNPTTPNLPAGPPYTACASEVILAPQAIPGTPLNGEFLHGLSFAAANLDELEAGDPTQQNIKQKINAATDAYYAAIDPRGKRSTLAQFRETNGFVDGSGTPLPGVVNTKYANSGDLGFGRDMYCQKQGASDGLTDYACYVSNYGDVTTGDLQDAIDAVKGGPPVATVAMEYSRIESAPGTASEYDDTTAPLRSVKFYAYDDVGNPLKAANLDGYGKRPLPQLCLVCHGGTLAKQTDVDGVPVPSFQSREDVKLGAVFVPFDLRYFTFPPSPNDKANADVQAKFKQLNTDIVYGVAQAVGQQAIVDVIDEMYAGGSATQQEDFAVSGWRAPAAPEAGKAAFYKGVVSNACRMCHTAQPIPQLRFELADQFVSLLGSVGTRVCTQHVMPHAKRTHDIFWGISDPSVAVPATVPHMAAQLQVFGGQFGTAADWVGVGGNPPAYPCATSFTGGGSTPPSYYQQNIQTLWGDPDYGCTGCHPSQSGAGGLGLGAAFSYTNLVGKAATQLPAMSRVKKLDSNNSYLFHKLLGDAGSVGGSNPSRMPLGCTGGDCVSPSDMTTIKDWIDVRGADGP